MTATTRDVYVDTSIVASWYVPDTLTTRALALRGSISPPVPLTALLHTEFVNALELKVFRHELPRGSADAVLAWFEADCRSGLFDMNPMDFDRVAREARAISRRHCALLGTRTLDVLHVALAVELGARRFATADDRQAAAAAAVGLTVIRP